MAVKSLRNQYDGVNAHLHSFLQAEGGWSEFHGNFINQLTNALKIRLIPMGYTAALEASLQIRRIDGSDTSYPESDLSIYDRDLVRASLPRALPPLNATGEMVVAIPEAMPMEMLSQKEQRATGIYTWRGGKPERGELVAWLELLSPSNKPGGQDSLDYLLKRQKLIEQGIVFVEIDFLHHTPPTLPILLAYPNENAHPYRILIIEPRPDVQHGVVRIHEFDVEMALPTLSIPLNAADRLSFDLDSLYQKAFAEGAYGLEWVDYSQLPSKFDRYSPSDQLKIVARMITVLEAQQRGENLETAFLPLVPIADLEAAVARLERLQ